MRALIHDAGHNNWLSFDQPFAVISATRTEDVAGAIDEVEVKCRENACFAAGFVCYEAAPGFDPHLATHEPGTLPLVWFGLFNKHAVVSGPTWEHVTQPDWTPDASEEQYKVSIAQIRALIEAGETYQVNHTIRLLASCSPPTLHHLLAEHNGQYGALIELQDWTLICGSPELFFEKNGSELISKPMKGTRPRGLMLDDDEAMSQELVRSEKDRAENLMIVDMVRNDMGRVAIPGSVEVPSLFEVEKYRTVWQMTSTVRCQTEASLAGVFTALFPPASITGAPKRHTMEIIREKETSPRGVYTGSIGFIRPDGSAQFNVAIRTAAVCNRSGDAVYGVGGGIVWDSDADGEWKECWHKAEALRSPMPDFSLFETLRWTSADGLWLQDRHLCRLRESAQYFGFDFCSEVAEQALYEYARTLKEPVRVRLTLSSKGKLSMESGPIPRPFEKAATVGISKIRVSSKDRFLYHKTTLRQIYHEALESCPGCDDAILINERGELTESTIANLAIRFGDTLVTPPVSCGLLPGILRAELLANAELQERVLTADDLHRNEGIFLFNSLRGIYQAALKEP